MGDECLAKWHHRAPARLRDALRRAPWILALGLVAASAVAEQVGPYEWRGVERVVAIGDLHGHYDQMLVLLAGAGLIDDRRAWTGGEHHLVLCGDLIDRGPDDRAILDLARKLQIEAAAAGGRVHVLLGNHEAMNLTRNYRYVAPESFADFAAGETGRERSAGFRKFRLRATGQGLSLGEVRSAFDERYPPGYFAWGRALAPDGEYGAWLIEQPTVIKVNGRLFLHGGLTERVAALGLEEINRRMRRSIEAFASSGQKLEGEVKWPAAFPELLTGALDIVERGGRRADGPVGRAARELLAAYEGLPFATDGPVWYRGNSVENERLERARVERVLELLDAEAQVVGHTVTRSGQIQSRFNGRLFRADVGMGYGRKGRALVLADGTSRVLNPASGSSTPVPAEPPQGEGWPQGEEELPDVVLERFLARAPIVSITEIDPGVPLKMLELQGDGMHLRAVFGENQETAEEAAAAGRRARRRYQHTVAAYRVDRLMGLNLVPVTVLRKIEGNEGLVQIWIQAALDQAVIEEYGRWSLLEGLDGQIARVAAFSALIGIEDRLPAGRMLLPISRRVLLADNSVSFYPDPRVDPYLPEGCGPVGAAFMASLRSLEKGELTEILAALVSDEAIDALLSRRDGLVERCENPAEDWSLDRIRRRVVSIDADGAEP